MAVKLQELHFVQCWNLKLTCFNYTTIRLTDKYKIGEEVRVFLNGHHVHNAVIVAKTKTKLDAINEFVARLDTGYSAQECKEILRKMYSKYNVNWDTQPLTIYLLNSNIPKS